MLGISSDFLQGVTWFLALIEIVLGLYLIATNAWHTISRHISALLLLSGLVTISTGGLATASSGSQAQIFVILLAIFSPAVLPLLAVCSLVLLKPEWLTGRGRRLWWGLYVPLIIPGGITLFDLAFGTRLWFSGFNPNTYPGGYVNLDTYTNGGWGGLSLLINYILPISISFVLPIYVLIQERSFRSRRFQWAAALLAAILIGMFAQSGLSSALPEAAQIILSSSALAIFFTSVGIDKLTQEGHLRRGRLQYRLTAIFLAITIPIILAVAFYVSSRSLTLLEQDALQTLQSENVALVNSSSMWFSFNVKALQQLLAQEEIQSMRPANQKALLESSVKTYTDWYLVSTTDLSGVNISRSDTLSLENYSDQAWFNDILGHAPLAYQTVIGLATRQPSLVVAAPIIRDGEFVGVGMFASDLDILSQRVRATTVGKTGVAATLITYVVDDQNKVIAHPSPEYTNKLVDFSDYPPVQAIRSGQHGRITFTDADGILWQAYIDTLSNGWGIIVQQQDAEVFQQLRQVQQASTTFVFGGALILVILIGFIVRQITSPIQQLTGTAKAIAEGALERTAQVESQDELGQLALAFNIMTDKLRHILADLEQQVADRTIELEIRSAYLQATADVSRTMTSILDPEVLMKQVVDLMRDRFSLYYVGLFLVDPTGEWAILRAGTGEPGQAMLARGHRIRIGAGMVGWSIEQARPRIALKAGEDPIRLATADLPNTRSEAALPLRSRDRVIGAISIQSALVNAFNDEIITVFQTLADQIAIAIDNARLFVESQESLNALQQTYAEESRQAWGRMLRRRAERLAYRCDQQGVTQASEVWYPEMSAAFESGQVVLSPDAISRAKAVAENQAAASLAIPIKVRGNVIGVLNARRPESKPEWHSAEITFVQSVVEQLGLALEGAQLYQETQTRAEREALQAEVVSRVRAAATIESLAQTLAEELGRRLNVSEVVVGIGRSKPNGREE